MANTAYMTSLQGILKLAVIGVSLIAFICAMVPYWSTPAGGGWTQFVAIITFMIVGMLFVIHFLDLVGKLPSPLMVELFIYVGLTVINFIAFCVACYLAANWGSYPHPWLTNQGALIAAAIFFAILLALLVVSLFFAFRDYRSGTSTETTVTGHQTTTTVTTTTTVPA